MEANELRINNYILTERGVTIIIGINPYKTGNYKPIPLTEQWLKDFGFEQNIPAASREYIFKDCKLINHYKNGFLFIMDIWDRGKMINYVHTLQNLYFALTGKELLICKQ
jgi:hypothetical protein